VAAEQEPGGVVIWEACRAGAGSAQGEGFLAGWWVWLSHTRMVPVPAGWGSSCSTWSWSQAGPDGWGGLGPAPGWGLAQIGGGDSGGCGFPGAHPRGWLFRCGVAGKAEGWVSCCVCVWIRAVAWHSQRGREPGRMEQRLCRTMGWGFGSPALLLLDHGVVKPSKI
jgi:hypothetical protein